MEDMLPPEAKLMLPPPAPHPEQSCPRCNSTNTKFCYYNNYSLSQPRYFCKSCRRYWTKGGTLRNVPVGGGCRRKQKHSSRRASHADTHFSVVPDTLSPNLTSLVSLGFEAVDIGFHFGGSQKLPDVKFPVLENLGSFQNSSLGGRQVAGFLDSLRSGNFLETPNSFGSFEKSFLNHDVGNGGVVGAYAESAAEMALWAKKAEPFSGNLEREGKVWWGLPGQVNSDHGDSSGLSRGIWTELNPSTWHGLLNNPLL